MLEDDLQKVSWLLPWSPVTSASHAEHLEDELHRETNPRHVLYRARVKALAFSDAEDVLFLVKGSPLRFALVHLTFSGKQDMHDDFPWTRFLNDVPSFVEWMKVEHDMRYGN